MSRPKKIHPPLKASFSTVLEVIATGSETGKHKIIKVAKRITKSKPDKEKPAK